MKQIFHDNRINLSFAFLLSLALFAQCQTPSTNKSLADLQWFSVEEHINELS